MGQHSNKLLGLLFLVFLVSIFFIIPRMSSFDGGKTKSKSPSIDSSTMETVDIIDPTEFLEHFSGKWKSEEISQIIEFKKIDDVLQVEINNEKKPDEDGMVELKVSKNSPVDNQWILNPSKDSGYRFILEQLSEDEIIFYSSTTRADTEGTSKPLNYIRLK